MNPPAEPFYVISFEEIILGGLMIGLTMAVHGIGMLLILRFNRELHKRLEKRNGVIYRLMPIVLASCLIMFVHLFEVMLWAAVFLWRGAFENISLAYYFSLNDYTTVGSKFSLPIHLRLLEGMLATAGLLTFAWSTGVLISLAREFQEQGMEVIRFRRRKKFDV